VQHRCASASRASARGCWVLPPRWPGLASLCRQANQSRSPVCARQRCGIRGLASGLAPSGRLAVAFGPRRATSPSLRRRSVQPMRAFLYRAVWDHQRSRYRYSGTNQANARSAAVQSSLFSRLAQPANPRNAADSHTTARVHVAAAVAVRAARTLSGKLPCAICRSKFRSAHRIG
jgi:hypothetical protein